MEKTAAVEQLSFEETIEKIAETRGVLQQLEARALAKLREVGQSIGYDLHPKNRAVRLTSTNEQKHPSLSTLQKRATAMLAGHTPNARHTSEFKKKVLSEFQPKRYVLVSDVSEKYGINTRTLSDWMRSAGIKPKLYCSKHKKGFSTGHSYGSHRRSCPYLQNVTRNLNRTRSA